MSDIAIKVENLSKSYRIKSGNSGNYTALRDVITERTGRFFSDLVNRKNPFGNKNENEIFWALNDVSFEVKKGEILGVIGRNGAGKSTLLKVLSRITEPDKGRIVMNGRVSSLLEVGTGFHPELTGRENIFLSGAILGMKRHEIKKHFDEIVDFAGVEKFIDTPVKRYSSGMYVRLGFAVAAHLETEILLVDEVLAVGDMEFQQKCLGKMGKISNSGKSVILVSHNLNSLSNICSSGIFIDNGKKILNSGIDKVIYSYKEQSEKLFAYNSEFKLMEADSNIDFRIERALLSNSDNMQCSIFNISDNICLNIEYVVGKKITGSIVNFEISDSTQCLLVSFDTDLDAKSLMERAPGHYNTKVIIPGDRFKPGRYYISIGTGIANKKKIHHLQNCLTFQIESSGFNDSFASFSSRRKAIMALLINWNTRRLLNEKK